MKVCNGKLLLWKRKKTRELKKSRQWEETINALQTDRETSERLARERFGYARPEENVARFEEDNDYE